ncbi:MAG TPA: ATP-binding protein [Kofleriaceae bacterium]
MRFGLELVALGVIAGASAGLVLMLLRATGLATRSARTYSEVFHASPTPLAVTDLATGRFVEVNAAYTKLVGWTRAELLGASAIGLGIAAADACIKTTRRLRRAGLLHDVPTQLCRKDGALRDVEQGSVLLDVDGCAFSISTSIDVTARLAAEQKVRQVETQMREAQKIESLGRLASGVAHDFNNLLAVISTNAYLVRDLLPADGQACELVDEIATTATHGNRLTRQLLAFSRKQAIEPVVLDLNSVVEETAKMLGRMIGPQVELVMQLDRELSRVLIDPGYLTQVVMNLAINARDAMPDGGKLVVETRGIAGEVMLAVRDTGTGMPEDVRAKIFEPFYTTKPPGKGTGMGLAVVHGIVQQAGGRITVETELGAGTTFALFLPSIDAPAAGGSKRAATGSETVLVVDDDAGARRGAARALRQNGYVVLEASDGETALGVIGGTAIDLLVTDVAMPGIDGRKLLDAARAAHPALKVILTTGYADDALRGSLRDSVELIEKPFGLQILSGRVRAVLDRVA